MMITGGCIIVLPKQLPTSICSIAEKKALEVGTTFSLLALFVTQLLAFLTNRFHKQIITQSV